MKTESPWQAALETAPRYPALDRELKVDALIIGAGITGLTAAYLLSKSGKSVAVLEKNTIGSAETIHTTAHVTYPTDMRLTELVKLFGEDHAQAAWDAQLAGSQKLLEIIHEEGINAELQYVPGYLYSAFEADAEKEAPELLTESQLASELGFDTSYIQTAPILKRPAIRFANQIKYHPGKYLAQLAEHIVSAGGLIFEQSAVETLETEPLRAVCNGHTVQYESVFIATHVPLQGNTGALSAALFQTKLAAYSTYAMEATLPAGSTAEALFWDTAEPYLYWRFDRVDDHDRVIIGGEDHKTGQLADTEECYIKLETRLRSLFPDAKLQRRWSGQVIETHDGLPLIGEITEKQYIATGYAGTGMTWGVVAAMMYHDYVMGIRNPWADLLCVNRKPLSKVWDYVCENKDYPYYYLKGLMQVASVDPGHLMCGEGKIIRYKGQKLAVYRQDDGQLNLHSAVCPHMGCSVVWNPAESTWDCPCHGSRFTRDGVVIAGPAESPLEKVQV